MRGATNLSIACPWALELCWVSRLVMVALTRMFSFLSLSASSHMSELDARVATAGQVWSCVSVPGVRISTAGQV